MSVPKTYEGRLAHILKLCNAITKTQNPAYKTNIKQWIDAFFSARRNPNNNYLSRFIDDIFNNCLDQETLDYMQQKIYENMLNVRTRFNTTVYHKSFENPFVIVFIDGHGKELDQNITHDTNLLAFNWSPAPGVITVNMSDTNTETILETFQNALSENPPTFTDIIDIVIEPLRTKYLTQLDEIDNDTIVTDAKYMLASKYKEHSCRIIRPIKNKQYNFDKILCPGIYVLGLVNTGNQTQQLLNLLIDDDLVALNKMYQMPDNNGETLLNNTNNTTLNDVCAYFRSLGIENVGLIDFSCRYMKNVCETKMRKQMVPEELGAHPKFRTFGGKKSYRRRKTKKMCV